MDRFLLRNLEDYLSGQLGEATRREFESRLARNPRTREQVGKMVDISAMFREFDVFNEGGLGPASGFCDRVLGNIEVKRPAEFWDLLLRPVVIRRVAMASCAWLVMLAAGTLYQSSAQPSTDRIAQVILAQPPESADYCNVRLGCDIDMNRSLMLAAVMVSGSSGR